jgi:dTDP-4-dehydrorhamnose reductase
MRWLIIGGDGMLGHQLLRSWQARHEVRVTLRGSLPAYRSYGLFSAENVFAGVDIRDTDHLLRILGDYRPQVVVNAAGLIKQREAAKEVLPALEVNAIFPHRLRLLCQAVGARMVHLSTDCVFNGRRGNYTEQDPSDAEDVYGRSKALGEVGDAPCLTLRSSIIGLELKERKGLIEWFLAQRGRIKGFTRAIYSGVTTAEMARIIERVATQHLNLHGVWQVASEPINKFELLRILNGLLARRDVAIEPDDSFACDRSLNGTAFTRETGYRPPSWPEMLAELAQQIQTERCLHEAA